MDNALHILIVEDNKLAQKIVMMLVHSLGYQAHTVNTGEEAIQQFKQRHFDFIFMDLGLPDMDGYTVVETMRALEEKKQTHTPIVALTAHRNDEIRQHAIRSGMDDFVMKPLTMNSAKSIIEKHIYSAL